MEVYRAIVCSVRTIIRILIALSISLAAFAVTIPSPALSAGMIVTSRTPDVNALDVARDTDITVQFGLSVNAATVDADSFNVDASLSGKIAGSYDVSDVTVTFNPTADFQVGETVTVTLTTDIESTSGPPLVAPVTWQFVVEAPSGDGTFPGGNNFGTGTDRTRMVPLGDVDGDGDLDIVVGNSNEQNVVYLNDGDGTFDTTSHNFGTGSDDTVSLALGDVDGDGDLDIAVGNSNEQNVVYLGDGDGTFDTTSHDFGTGADDTYSLALGDVDGDGDLDIAAGDVGQNVVYLGDGDGTFDTSSNNFGTGGDKTVSLALGDVDGDGDLDIAVGNKGQQNVVYLNDGDGTFPGGGNSFGTGTDNTLLVALGDVDGDGDLDIVAGNHSQQNVVYLGDGDGTFDTTSHDFGTGADVTYALPLGDVDGDGDLDIAAGNYAEQNVVYLNAANEINLKQGTTNIPDGGSYDFSSRPIATDTDITFTIENTGTWSLTLTIPITIGGVNADQFSIQAQPASPVAASGSTTFTVRFSPTSVGAKTATISIVNDDSDENPYDLTLQGTGAPHSGGGGVSATSGVGSINLTSCLDLQGRAITNITLTSTNGLATMGIPYGTRALNAQGNRLEGIQIIVLSTPPPPPGYVLVGHAYDCLPAGATFQPAITLTLRYREADIPDGVSEQGLVMAYYDGTQWVTLPTTANTINNTATSKVAHFTPFAILAYTGLASFSASNLSIQPLEVQPQETVTITLSVANTGDVEGSYSVVLKVNGATEAEKSVTLAAGSSENIAFSVTREEAGSYSVTVDGLSGSFTVAAPASPASAAPPASPAEAKPPISWMWIGIIAAVVVVGLIIFLLVRRRAY